MWKTKWNKFYTNTSKVGIDGIIHRQWVYSGLRTNTLKASQTSLTWSYEPLMYSSVRYAMVLMSSSSVPWKGKWCCSWIPQLCSYKTHHGDHKFLKYIFTKYTMVLISSSNLPLQDTPCCLWIPQMYLHSWVSQLCPQKTLHCAHESLNYTPPPHEIRGCIQKFPV